MLFSHMLPTAILWLVAVILAIINPGTVWGVSHHTYTGVLFFIAVVVTIWAVVKGRQKEKAQEAARGYKS